MDLERDCETVLERSVNCDPSISRFRSFKEFNCAGLHCKVRMQGGKGGAQGGVAAIRNYLATNGRIGAVWRI